MDTSNIIVIILIAAVAFFVVPRMTGRRGGGSAGPNLPGNRPGNDRGIFPTTRERSGTDAPKGRGGDMVDRVEDEADDRKRSI